MLYAGTTKPIPRREFDEHAPNLSVNSLADEDSPVRAPFSKPEVQYIGSTSGCGCDFPHLMMQNGEWPKPISEDTGRDDSQHHNMEALVALLRTTGEETVELYGIWAGDWVDSLSPPFRFNFQRNIASCQRPSNDRRSKSHNQIRGDRNRYVGTGSARRRGPLEGSRSIGFKTAPVARLRASHS
jgi:hypothetical protein